MSKPTTTDGKEELRRIAANLNSQAEAFAIHLLGKPTSRNNSELRFYPRGGLSVGISGSRQGFWKDFGAGEGGDMLKLYTYVKNADIAEAIRYAKQYLGDENIRQISSEELEQARQRNEEKDAEDQKKRVRVANFIWERAGSADGTMASRYLANRAIPVEEPLPSALRHRKLASGDCEKMGIDPAPFAPEGLHVLVQGATDLKGDIKAVQQVLLHKDRKAEGLDNVKRTNGVMLGAAVKLSQPRDSLVLAEGGETAAAIHYTTSHAAWGTLGASNFTRVEVPDHVQEIIIAAEREESGVGLAKAVEAAGHWNLKGYRAGISLARTGDHNDVLEKHGPEAVNEDLDNTRFATNPMSAADKTAILVRDSEAALEIWAATGAYVKSLPKGFARGTAPDLPEATEKVIFALDATSTPKSDDFLTLLHGLSKQGHEVRIARLANESFTEHAGSAGAEGLRYLFENATPPGRRMPAGIETLAIATQDQGVLVVDRAENIEAARELFPNRVALAPSHKDPRKTDWSCLKGRDVLVAPANSPESYQSSGRVLAEARKQGAKSTQLVDWPIVAPGPNGFTRLRGKPPLGYAMKDMKEDGWTRKDVEDTPKLKRSTAVLGD